MPDTFFESSKEIANDFLESIVFIDDKAYVDEESNNHEFHASQITQSFAKSKKVCAVYKPVTLADIDDLALIAKKADITVIDWQINVRAEIEETEDAEEDAEEDDPRGPHTKKIIREILSDPLTGKGSLKLIVIYTGEIGLYDITDEIYNDLNKEGIKNLQKNDCAVVTNNIKILVIAKPSGESGESKFKHNPKLNKKVVTYEDLPDFILTEFTKMTSGLLSNFVLKSLTTLRNNTFRLIKLYDKDLDVSFLSHRLLLPDQENSKEQLIEVLSHSIRALLNYNQVGESVSTDQIIQWIDQSEFSDSVSVAEKEIILDNNFLKSLFSLGIEKTLKVHWENKGYGQMTQKIPSKFQKKLHSKGSTYLMKENDSNSEDCRFSILTHHKSNLKQPNNIPKLSLGTIIKQNDTEDYFLCIQAKCDSVRITDERKFLFLPLTSSLNRKFQIVVEDGDTYIKLEIPKEAYKLRTIKFVPTKHNDKILGQLDDSSYYFTSTYEEKFLWICDLKDAHAQRVANAYSAQLSRVGLDESEWLRRWST